MTDIINGIPYPLSFLGGIGSGGSYSLTDYEFDYAIGGIPFLSATRDEWPHTQQMAEIRKEQFDSFAEPGEQSLSGWWLRSQSNFSAGAGVLYQDPDNDNQFNYRFTESLGVDPWTNGELKLLRNSTNRATLTSSNPLVRGYVDPTAVDSAWLADGNNFSKVTDSAITGIASIGTAIQSLASSGTRYLFTKVDAVYSGIDTAAPAQMYTFTATNTLVEFVKSRLAVAVDNALYFRPINTGAAVAITAAGTASFTHTNSAWVWTSITEGPNAIYAAGNDGVTGSIFKFTLDATDGSVPALGSDGIITAQMPRGELINTIFGYVGTFIGIATNKGFRVGEIDANGDVVYGPLLFEPTGGCKGVTGNDRFMWTGSTLAHDGQSGLYRVDLGNQIQEQTTRAVRYAFARDVYAAGEVNSVNSVDMFGASDRKIFTVTADSLWHEDAEDLLASGYLETGRVRFNTEEPKLYKFVSLRTPIPLQGNVQLSVLTQAGQEIPYITFSPDFSPATGDVATPQPNGPQNWLALKFTLSRGATDPTIGGVLNGWQIKVLPGSIRQRIITHSFLLYDREKDKGGQQVGFNGYADERLELFKALARAGDVVVFQELQKNISTLVIIDDWRYTQLTPPSHNKEMTGGILTVVMRTVAEST